MNLTIPTMNSSVRHGRRPGLVCFVLGSLLLHALVVGLWRGEPAAGPVGQSTFQVTLLARYGDAPDKPGAEQQREQERDSRRSTNRSAVSGERSEPVEDQPQKPLPLTDRATRLRALARMESKLQQPEARSGADAQKAPDRGVEEDEVQHVPEIYAAMVQGHISAIRGSTSHGQHPLSSAARYRRVRAELLKALLPYFEYPPLARRRGWQGRVRVGMLVEADGDLTGVQLIESSGHTLLDEAAVRNVRALSQVPAAMQWLEGSEMDIILPVSYRLEDR